MSDLRPVHYAEIAATLKGKAAEVHELLTRFGVCTPKELAKAYGWDITSIRPRLTELKDAGLVETTGVRRNDEHVFRAVSLDEAARRAGKPAGETETQLSLV